MNCLDLQIYKSKRFDLCGRFDCCPFMRNEGPVLTHLSSHPVPVNMSWPVAVLVGLWHCSSSLDSYLYARRIFITRCRNSGIGELY